MNCPLCDTHLQQEIDKFYFVCDTCGAYVKNSVYYVDAEDEKERYEEHENDVNDLRYQAFTSPISNYVLQNYGKQDLGLDYGCGTGPVISKVLTDKGYQVNLYDPYFYPKLENLDCKYDYIFSCEVFEHFYHPKIEIEKLLGILRAGGHLIIMTHLYDKSKNFNSWYYRNDPTHVFIYTEQTIRFIAQKFDLRIEILNERLIVFESSTSNERV